MDDPVHSRRTAIFAETQPHRLPTSFYPALGFALALHSGFAWYLLQQNFSTPIHEPRILPGDTITIEMPPPPVPKTAEAPKPTVQVHKTPVPIDPVVETTPLVPVDKPLVAPETTTVPVLTTRPVETTSSSSEAGPAYVTARWTRFPDGVALTNYYPPRAEADEVEGKATVQCTVLDNAGRVSCVSVAENPPHYGFGAATARMVQDKGRVDTTQGNVQVGSVLRQTVVWKLD